MVVDEDSTLNVYITDSADIASGEVLRYTVAAPPTPDGYANGMIIDVLGQTGAHVEISLTAIQCDCWRALQPISRPISVPGPDQAIADGSVVALDGSSSYDPTDQTVVLQYAWSLVMAPDGSIFKLSDHGGLSVGGINGYTNTFSASSGSGAFSSVNAPVLQPGDTLILTLGGQRYAYTISSARWIFVDSKWVRDLASGWDDDQVQVTRSIIPAGLTDVYWEVLHSKAFFNSTSASKPYAVPDVVGLYEVQLIVNNGVLDSLPVTELVNVTSTSLALGIVPDVSFVWDHLTNFWQLLEDKDKLTSVWSAFAQAASNILMTAWQIDYNKSLKDIQRTFQRRWLSYSTVLSDLSMDIRIVRSRIVGQGNFPGPYNINGLTLDLIVDDSPIITITFHGDPGKYVAAWSAAEQINKALADFGYLPVASVTTSYHLDSAPVYLQLEYPQGLLQVLNTGTANLLLGFTVGGSPAYLQNDLVGTGTVGSSRASVSDLSFMPGPRVDLVSAKVGSGDLFVVTKVGGTASEAGRVLSVAQASTVESLQSVNLRDALSLDAADSVRWEVPSVVTSDIDFVTELVRSADAARFSVKDLTTGLSVDIYCDVLGVAGNQLGFDPRPLLRKWNGNVAQYETVFTGVKRTQCIRLDDLVVAIPRLQAKVQNPLTVYEENRDYRISEVGVGTGTVRALEFVQGVFSSMNPPPDALWAEATLLDNRPAIEANFGHLVPPFSLATYKEIEAQLPNLDYLSAVQGLWYAYWGGPSVYRMRVGLQILLGLPFAEESGTVVEINERFSTKEGRILIRDTDGVITRSYFYPSTAGLMVWEAPNANAGRTLKVGDAVPKFTPLTGGIEILDWINSPDWAGSAVASKLISGLQKYFQFMVRGDVDTFDPQHIIYAIDFIKNIKPHYTQAIVVLQKKISSELDVIDTLEQVAKLKIVQTIDPLGRGAYRWDDYDGAGTVLRFFDEEYPQFIWDHDGLCPRTLIGIIPSDATEVDVSLSTLGSPAADNVDVDLWVMPGSGTLAGIVVVAQTPLTGPGLTGGTISLQVSGDAEGSLVPASDIMGTANGSYMVNAVHTLAVAMAGQHVHATFRLASGLFSSATDLQLKIYFLTI